MLADGDARRIATEEFGANIALSAGAGSGKTTVLVSRYLEILRQGGVDVSQLVAVTFTEKAAAEMRERIRKDCRVLAREAESDEERRRWQRHERDLESAPVSTIHSLCNRILREHSIAAAIDPQFGVMEEATATLLMSETVHRHILRRVHDGAESMRPLVAAYGVERLRDIICDLLGGREKWLAWVANVNDAKQFVRARLSDGAAIMAGTVDELVQDARWRGALATIESTEPLNPEDRAAQQRAEILRLEPQAADAGREIEERLAALAELRTHCRKYGSKANWPSPEELADVREAFGALAAAYDDRKGILGSENPDVAQSSAHLSAALAIELRAAHDEYQRAKRQRSLMDFADLQLKARDLLSEHPDIRRQYQEQFKYIMVDEFQDTNDLQKEILFTLAGAPCSPSCQPGEHPETTSPPGKLFIVGDDKQSIYRFRGADVSVFNLTRDEFGQSNDARTLDLSVNFRSQPGLVSFYNDLFGHDVVMGLGDPETPYSARYFPLDPHRDARPDESDVEILLAKGDGESDQDGDTSRAPTLDELREIEAAAIARRIAEMCSGGLNVFDPGGAHAPQRDDSEGPRDAEYGDIAILFRALSDVRTYERALRQRGIPYYLIAGQGLYRRQEIRDLLCLLRALENTRAEVSLVGALRSPLFSISDETLYWICRRRQPYDALARIVDGSEDEQFAAIASDERDKVARAAELLGELRQIKDRLSVSELLTRAVEETGYLGALLAQFNGEQMASNVRKLIDLAGGFERGPAFSLHDFIDYLQDLVVTEQREGEAPIQGEEENVVKLLTIHRAKGLQWPVVIVPDLARGSAGDRDGWRWHDDHGLIVQGEDASGKRCWPAVGACAKALDDDMEQAERRRLLYVACTRARDHLVLSSPWQSTKDGQPRGGQWLQWIAEALAIDNDTADGPLAAAEGSDWAGLLQSFGPEATELPPRSRRSPSLASRHESQLKDRQPLPGATGEDDLIKRTRPLPVAAADQQRFTVTQLATYLACPRQYELRYVLDLPEYSPPSPGRREQLLSPLDRGTVAHRCLQRIGREREDDVERVVRSCLREFGLAPAADEPTQRDIAGMVNAFLETPLFQLVRNATRLRTEAPFAMPLDGGVIVEGQVDAAAWDADGAIHLIDYKTGRGDDRAMEQYRFQLALYCAAVEAAFGTPPASATLYQLEQAESHAIDLPEDTNQAMENALAAIEGIRAGRFPRGDGRHCPRCRHEWICAGAEPGS